MATFISFLPLFSTCVVAGFVIFPSLMPTALGDIDISSLPQASSLGNCLCGIECGGRGLESECVSVCVCV